MTADMLPIPRDTWIAPSYWSSRLARYDVWLARFEHTAALSQTTADHRRSLRFNIFLKHLHRLITLYSAGYDLAALTSAFPAVVNAFRAYQLLPGHEQFDLSKPDMYNRALWVVALAVLLDQPQPLLLSLVQVIGNQGRDAIYDRLVQLRFPETTGSATLLHPLPYRYLLEALQVDEPDRSRLVTVFLSRWYRGMRHVYWHDTHLQADSGFFGYWCFELAAFVKELRWQDQAYRTNVYYPAAFNHED